MALVDEFSNKHKIKERTNGDQQTQNARIKQRKVLASYIITPCTSKQIAGVRLGCALHPPAFAAGSSGQGSARLTAS